MWGCHLPLSGSRRNDGCGLFVATEGKVICPSVASPGDSMAPAPFDGIPYLCKSPTCANKSPTWANEVSLKRTGSQRCYRPTMGFSRICRSFKLEGPEGGGWLGRKAGLLCAIHSLVPLCLTQPLDHVMHYGGTLPTTE